MRNATLIKFFGLTFGLTWGIAALLIAFPDRMTAVFGELSTTSPLFIAAVYSPGLVGTFLVWRMYRGRGLIDFFRRLTLWRLPLWGWIFTIIGVPALMYGGALVGGSAVDTFPFSPWQGVIPALALALLLGPIEEFGWRGVALPLMQRKLSPFWAGSILGVIWMVWHLPAFVIDGTPQSAWTFAPYFVGGVSISLILTAMFNESGGSLLAAVVLHFQLNNPIWPDAQPWDSYMIAVVAIAMVWVKRSTMFDRSAGSTALGLPARSTIQASSRSYPSMVG